MPWAETVLRYRWAWCRSWALCWIRCGELRSDPNAWHDAAYLMAALFKIHKASEWRERLQPNEMRALVWEQVRKQVDMYLRDDVG